MHIQQFVNARNVRYEPCGEWDHFPPEIFGQPKATRPPALDSESSDTESTSGTSLTSDEDEDSD